MGQRRIGQQSKDKKESNGTFLRLKFGVEAGLQPRNNEPNSRTYTLLIAALIAVITAIFSLLKRYLETGQP